MTIDLAIETSCDETSVAIVQNGKKVLAIEISSQIKKHQEFGGVVPELASRLHTEIIHFLLEQCFKISKSPNQSITKSIVILSLSKDGNSLIRKFVNSKI